MQRRGELTRAPALIDAQRKDGVEEYLALVVVGFAGDCERWRCGRANASAGADVDRRPAATARRPAAVLKRQGRRQAGAELPRIAKTVNADLVGLIAGARIGDGIGIGRDDVEKRTDAARRRPGELNEGAGDIKG